MVKLVNAKCPSCGASLKLSKEDENVKCEYCHSNILVDDAVACYKIKISGNVSVEGVSTNSDLLEAANELLNMNEYLKAKRKFLEFSEKCPDNYQGWLGLLICRTRNFTIKDNNIMFENDVNRFYEHFKKTAPKEIQNQYFEIIDKYFNPNKYKIKQAEEQAEKIRQEYEELKRKKEENKRIKAEEKIRRKEQLINNPKYKNAVETTRKGKNVFLKIINGFLYFFGGTITLAGFVAEGTIVEKVFIILIGLSFFKIFYTFIGTKFNISKKVLLIMRYILPFILLLLMPVS